MSVEMEAVFVLGMFAVLCIGIILAFGDSLDK
jgi:hypothetical protein